MTPTEAVYLSWFDDTTADSRAAFLHIGRVVVPDESSKSHIAREVYKSFDPQRMPSVAIVDENSNIYAIHPVNCNNTYQEVQTWLKLFTI